jgi:hypothetical protein
LTPVRFFFRSHIPKFERVLVIESGSRYLIDDLLPGVYEIHGPGMRLDLLTCFAGQPKSFRPEQGRLWQINDYPGGANRRRLFAELGAQGYNVTGMICSGEPIMTKWKWAAALRLPGKVFILNENGDYFWFDRTQWRTIRHFILFRAGLAGAGAVRTLVRLALLPLTLFYLCLYAAAAHARRRMRAYQR